MIHKRKKMTFVFILCAFVLAGCTGNSRAYFDTHPTPLLQAKQKSNGNNIAINYEYCIDCLHANDQLHLGDSHV